MHQQIGNNQPLLHVLVPRAAANTLAIVDRIKSLIPHLAPIQEQVRPAASLFSGGSHLKQQQLFISIHEKVLSLVSAAENTQNLATMNVAWHPWF